MSRGIFIIGLLLWASISFAQEVSGKITDIDGAPLEGFVLIESTSYKAPSGQDGKYSLSGFKAGTYKLVAFVSGYQTTSTKLTFQSNQKLTFDFVLEDLNTQLEEVTITEAISGDTDMGWLQSVSGSAIYESKKTELIEIDKLIGNKAANVGRQVYSRVPGLNIWENDGAGINLGIGGRGLNPNRTSNFNVRQNGYDISADALGYPESYYTPPIQALQRIELVRGAAGLQYGTQFGGMLNFQFKEGPKNKKIGVSSTQSLGSFGLFNSFNSLGGTVGKVNYYGFYQYKTSEGWRPNSDQSQHNLFGSVTYNISPLLNVKIEHTHMSYLAHQPGGMTDDEFNSDPSISKRERNWFQVGWDLSAMEWNYRVNNSIKFNNRTFLLSANRYAVGNLENINEDDDLSSERNLLKDEYFNWGNELRAIIHYPLLGKKSVMIIGNRLYFGKTDRRQGEGSASSGADFDFIEQQNSYSEYLFPSTNVSVFVENVFNLTDKWSVTPGARFEYIKTQADGFYYYPVTDFAGNILRVDREDESRDKSRHFMIFGLGTSYKASDILEIYANYSQNYKAINFNDIRVINPSLTVDENISDEFGYNADIGIRGGNKAIKYDISVFYLRYNDRIGPMLSNRTGARFRTNVGDANIYGFESYIEGDLLKWLKPGSEQQSLTAFVNLALIKSEYVRSERSGIVGNEVELVPLTNLKTGLTYRYKSLGISYLYTYLSEQYSDASNAVETITAVEGLIPAYHVMDISLDYTYRFMRLETGINNLRDESYFTRRAAGYPGPGIIPANPRNFYVSIGFNF